MRELQWQPVDHVDHVLSVITQEDIDMGKIGKAAQNGGVRCHFRNQTTKVFIVHPNNLSPTT
jgi:hypothetical protein